ncbi:polysaccharide biosynthesis tyrosine autokinase [Dactylosporangium sp. NPDC005555]|uniref:polysaccharide biosynthesis tyrosine autokinase n=1 Tax=Dactylosporangium sp. NPDC005555 TaxID=3154889 RepID=UPI0033AE69A9
MFVAGYLKVVLKRWWCVAITVALAAGAAYIYCAAQTPRYATSLTFFVTTPNRGVSDAYQGNLFTQQRVKSYASLLVSDRLAAKIAADPRIGLDAKQVRARITAAPVPDTVLLRAVVTDVDQVRAERIAARVATDFKAMLESLETPAGSTDTPIKVEVISGPESQAGPVSPRPVRDIGGAVLVGLILGVALAIQLELLDSSVRDADHVQEITERSVIAHVPFDTSARREPLLVGEAGFSARAEALRGLRTNLQFLDVDNPPTAVVITSSLPGEGKSSTAANLGIVLAETGQRVLLIDGDLRRPSLAGYFDIEGAVGLTNVLAGQVSIDETVQQWNSSLWILPSGIIPPNPSELLGSRQMAELLAAARAKFDMVIIDSPPLLSVTDAAILATRTDGVVYVSRSGRTTTTQMSAAIKAIKAVDARLLGTVLNMEPRRQSSPYHYYQYATEAAAQPVPPTPEPALTGERHRSRSSAG